MDVENLIEGFEYDLWANLQWLETLQKKGLSEPDRAIFAHALSANQIWLLRVQGSSPDRMPVVELSVEALTRLRDEWVVAIKANAHDPKIDYKRTTGEEMHTIVSQIALHVINHGTYHRGELRGLCLAREDTDFPETDRILFTFIAMKS